MTNYLCISVKFLDPFFHGRGDDEPEWPPSPMRLFQALLAGSRTGCRGNNWDERRAEAFRWLASSTPPLIVAPRVQLGSHHKFFVPNNDSDKEFDRQDRLTGKTAWPHRLVDGDTVHFVWPIEESDWTVGQSHAEVLCREARYLLALGWGIDQVVGNGRILTDAEMTAISGQRWRAWSVQRPGTQTWRIPSAASLEDLERVHQSFLNRIDGKQYHPPLKLSRFNSVFYLANSVLPPRSYAAFELPEGIAFRQERANEVAAMLRSLTCKCALTDTHEFPGDSETYVAGHVNGTHGKATPRFSFLPLPTIGHEHSDGRIRRLLIAEPYGGDATHAHWAQRRITNQVLRDNDGNERGVLLKLWRVHSSMMVDRYVAESQSWATVTPVILPGFDDGKQVKAEKLLIKAMKQAGIDPGMVKELALRKAPFWPSSQHPRCYRRPHYLKHLPAWHVRVLFQEPVPGPLTVGAGRHCGLGIFARMDCD